MTSRPGRYFVFNQGDSNKFWKIELTGSAHTVTFGRLGTAGQTKTKSFADSQAAQTSYDKLVAQKLKKGYVESAEKASAAPRKDDDQKSTTKTAAKKTAAKKIAAKKTAAKKTAATKTEGDAGTQATKYELVNGVDPHEYCSRVSVFQVVKGKRRKTDSFHSCPQPRTNSWIQMMEFLSEDRVLVADDRACVSIYDLKKKTYECSSDLKRLETVKSLLWDPGRSRIYMAGSIGREWGRSYVLVVRVPKLDVSYKFSIPTSMDMTLVSSKEERIFLSHLSLKIEGGEVVEQVPGLSTLNLDDKTSLFQEYGDQVVDQGRTLNFNPYASCTVAHRSAAKLVRNSYSHFQIVKRDGQTFVQSLIEVWSCDPFALEGRLPVFDHPADRFSERELALIQKRQLAGLVERQIAGGSMIDCLPGELDNPVSRLWMDSDGKHVWVQMNVHRPVLRKLKLDGSWRSGLAWHPVDDGTFDSADGSLARYHLDGPIVEVDLDDLGLFDDELASVTLPTKSFPKVDEQKLGTDTLDCKNAYLIEVQSLKKAKALNAGLERLVAYLESSPHLKSPTFAFQAKGRYLEGLALWEALYSKCGQRLDHFRLAIELLISQKGTAGLAVRDPLLVTIPEHKWARAFVWQWVVDHEMWNLLEARQLVDLTLDWGKWEEENLTGLQRLLAKTDIGIKAFKRQYKRGLKRHLKNRNNRRDFLEALREHSPAIATEIEGYIVEQDEKAGSL